MLQRCFSFATVVLAAGLGLASPASADPGRGAAIQCYVWANSPSPTINAPYEPSSTYSYDAVGRAQGITVTKLGTGTYSVTCAGVGGGALETGSGSWGAGGHVQVTAYGSDNHYCKVVDWGTGSADFTAYVHCYGPGGGLRDSQFDLLFVW